MERRGGFAFDGSCFQLTDKFLKLGVLFCNRIIFEAKFSLDALFLIYG